MSSNTKAIKTSLFATIGVFAMFASASLAGAMSLESPNFNEGGQIPTELACPDMGGSGLSPALVVSSVPTEAKFLTVIMDDPEAPSVVGQGGVHWILSDIPAENGKLPSAKDGAVGVGTTGSGDSGKRYGGPCPPKSHTYVITVYATSEEVGKLSRMTRAKFEKKFKSVIIDSASLTGVFP
jgi:Raf kinase inhibitor-like YbhB/YbcL family protein